MRGWEHLHAVGDVCVEATCTPGAPVDCDDGDACTEDSCSEAAGCQTYSPSCDDGLACTVDDCDPATGCTFTPDDSLCATAGLCETGVCDPESGCTPQTVPNCCGNGTQEAGEENATMAMPMTGMGVPVPACWKMRVPPVRGCAYEAEPTRSPSGALSWSFGRALRNRRGAFRRLGRCRFTQKVTFLDPPVKGGKYRCSSEKGWNGHSASSSAPRLLSWKPVLVRLLHSIIRGNGWP